MPKSHDAKPRNRHRRTKAAKRQRGKTLSLRSVIRRVRSPEIARLFDAQQALEHALREKGIRWRQIEIAIRDQKGGRWTKLDDLFVAVKEAA